MTTVAYSAQHKSEQKEIVLRIGLHHPLDGITNPKYKLLHFIQLTFFSKKNRALGFNQDRCCHQALCLRLILFHCHKILQIISFSTFYSFLWLSTLFLTTVAVFFSVFIVLRIVTSLSRFNYCELNFKFIYEFLCNLGG